MIQPLEDCSRSIRRSSKISRVPQGVEVAFQRRLIVYVARLGEHAGTDGFRRNAAVAVNDDLGDHVLLRYGRPGQQQEC
jgi:hypothetical protein